MFYLSFVQYWFSEFYKVLYNSTLSLMTKWLTNATKPTVLIISGNANSNYNHGQLQLN